MLEADRLAQFADLALCIRVERAVNEDHGDGRDARLAVCAERRFIHVQRGHQAAVCPDASSDTQHGIAQGSRSLNIPLEQRWTSPVSNPGEVFKARICDQQYGRCSALQQRIRRRGGAPTNIRRTVREFGQARGLAEDLLDPHDPIVRDPHHVGEGPALVHPDPRHRGLAA